MKGLSGLLQQAQKMQADMGRIKQELATLEVVGTAGAGMVEVRISGDLAVRAVRIEASALAGDRELLEDLIAAAVNDAINRAQAASAEKMRAAMGGLNLPGGLPFGFG